MRLVQGAVKAVSLEPIMKQQMKKETIKEEKMEESIQKLRLDFEAETDISIDKSPADWQQYAMWLEQMTVNELNGQMVKENLVLKDMMQEAMTLLQEGIVKRID